ncbi:MAG: hypothetical protein JWQ98_3272 [Chlorobi bacterium]|nr:hypothetical protein [Chlorobiota bacterium]
MTTEELILGHFDKALTPDEESRLQKTLSGSPEARALYDQHAALQQLLASDVAGLAPSAGLDKLAIAGALGAVPEAIGGGAAGWLGGKMVAGIAAVLVGGASIAMLVNSGSNQNQIPPVNVPASQQAPVVRVAPAVPTPESPKTEAAPETVKPVADVAPATSRVVKPVRKQAIAAVGRKAGTRLSIDSKGTDIKDSGIKVHGANSK